RPGSRRQRLVPAAQDPVRHPGGLVVVTTFRRASSGLLLLALLGSTAAAADHFIDCTSGDDLDRINATEFSPGHRILFKRGATCSGQLWPKGSGEAGRPITISAYGEGPLPVIDGKGHESAVRLFNQHHWVIQNIVATGSSEYGIH